MPPLKIAQIIADEREVMRQHHLPEPYFGPAPSTLLAGLSQTPGVEVHVMSCVRRPVPEPPRLAGNIFFHAVRVPAWGFLKTSYLPCIMGIRKKLREIQPDMVHGQGTEAYYALAAAYSGFPNVITIHGHMRQVANILRARPLSFYWLIARLESLTVRRAGGVLCQNHYTQHQVESLTDKTWLVPNAVDEDFFKVERSAGMENTILCVANVAPYKNQNQLIRVLDAVAAEHKFRLVFLGGMNEARPYCREFMQLVKERPWCVYKGFQKGDALRKNFQSAHSLILPSLEDNCPMVVLEAMASGVPVAASNIGGIPDLIDNGVNGLLFDPANPAAIRAAVLKLLSDLPTAAAMAAEGRKRALERYHPRVIARQHLEVYREVLARRR